jgi:TPR repeat protein
MKKDPKLIEIYKHSSNNEIEILHSKEASCFFCRQNYSARKVNDWINDERGVTAICPECGMDAVIGDASGVNLDKTLLKDMNIAYYGEDYMEKHPAAAAKYVQRYKEGKITHKKANEALYIQYLALLAKSGNAAAAYDLGSIYENGSEFTEKDPSMAFAYYSSSALRSDGGALTRLGVLSETGALGKVDPKGAYECYAKAMAMGSLEALVRFADCYRKGLNVPSDPAFAFEIVSSIWSESYSRFINSAGKDINIFPDLAYRIGLSYEEGFGVKKDAATALRYYLYAEFGFGLFKGLGYLRGNLESQYENIQTRIAKIAKSYHLRKQDPVFDNDTFADSLEEQALAFLAGPTQKLSFTPGLYDKSNNTFAFDINYDIPPLIVDVGNLFCGFVAGTIRWDFVDVSDVKLGHGDAFDKIVGDPDDGWALLSNERGEEENICSIVFTRNPQKKKTFDSHKGKA